jgi:predicted nuclease with TOPRIM domain
MFNFEEIHNCHGVLGQLILEVGHDHERIRDDFIEREVMALLSRNQIMSFQLPMT